MTKLLEWIDPRELKVGDVVQVGENWQTITRINSNRIRVTVYFMRWRGADNTERGFTYWLGDGYRLTAKRWVR